MSYCYKSAMSELVCVTCLKPVILEGKTEKGREIFRCPQCGKLRNRRQRKWLEYNLKIIWVTPPKNGLSVYLASILQTNKEAEE